MTRWPTWLAQLLLLTLLTCAIRAPGWHPSVVAVDGDEAVYLVIAQQWLGGHLPYVTAWDQHPVGLPALLAGLGWLAGDVQFAGRVAASVAVALTAWLILRLVSRETATVLPGMTASLAYVLFMTRLEALPAQTEVFNNALVAGAAVLLFGARRRPPGRDLPALAGAGVLLGCALQIKYVVLPECVLLSCWYLLMRYHGSMRRLVPPAAVLLLCGLAPSLVVAGTYLAAGEWTAFRQANFDANLAYVVDLPAAGRLWELLWRGLRQYGVLLLVAAATLVATIGQRRGEHRGLGQWLACWLLAAWLNVCLPMKFWGHYFLALLPPLAIAAGIAMALLAENLRGRRRTVALAVLAGCLLLPPARVAALHLRLLHEFGRTDAPDLVAAEIARLGPGGLYVYNGNPVLYYLTGRTPPTRYILPLELTEYAASSGARGQQEVAAVMARRPRYVVTADPPRYAFPAKLDALVQRWLAGYEVVASYPDPVGEGMLLLHVARDTL